MNFVRMFSEVMLSAVGLFEMDQHQIRFFRTDDLIGGSSDDSISFLSVAQSIHAFRWKSRQNGIEQPRRGTASDELHSRHVSRSWNRFGNEKVDAASHGHRPRHRARLQPMLAVQIPEGWNLDEVRIQIPVSRAMLG